MAAEPHTTPASAKGKATRYVILKQRDDSNDWYVEAMDEIGPGPAAIKRIAKQAGEGMYAAVPTRSWQPEPAKVRTETIVTVGGA